MSATAGLLLAPHQEARGYLTTPSRKVARDTLHKTEEVIEWLFSMLK